MKNFFAKTKPSIFILVFLFLGLISNVNRVTSYVWFNMAQYHKLTGQLNIPEYVNAVRLNPDNQHFKWQLGVAYATVGEYDLAAEILEPLCTPTDDPQKLSLLANVYAEAGKTKDLIALFLTQGTTLDLSPKAASLLLSESLSNSSISFNENTKKFLISQILGISRDAAELSLLTSLKNLDVSNQSSFTQNLLSVIRWRTQADTSYRRTNFDWRVPRLLAQVVNDSEFGAELVPDPDFENPRPQFIKRDEFQTWRAGFMSSGDPWNRGLFAVGLNKQDPFSGSQSLRIQGLMLENLPSKEPARAVISLDRPIMIQSGASYLITLIYRTRDIAMPQTGAALWLNINLAVFFTEYKFLPDTNGQWKKMLLLVKNHSATEAPLTPNLGLFSEGQVDYDDFSIRQIPDNVIQSLPITYDTVYVEDAN